MKKYKILIVDDIFVNRKLLCEVIKKIGCEFYEAENGKAAINALNENSFDVILMDIEMPVMNGLETTRYIRENFTPPKNNIPIIALTAHNPADFFDDFNDVGFNQLITKPYIIDKITKIFDSVLI